MNKNKQAFTLVELIVVITILAILGTIAFISLQGYSASSRDSVRISDVSNMEIALELFHLNTGKYPLPDDYGIIDYDGEDLWYQGTFGSTVVSQLSRNISDIPKDPLIEKEYVFSTANNKNEFQILTLLEGDISMNILTQINAATVSVTPKIDGTYNGIFIKTANYIVPTPTIITSEDIGVGVRTTLDNINIKSQIIDGGDNIPNIGNINHGTGTLTGLVLSVYTGSVTKNTNDVTKEIVMNLIKDAYLGCIELINEDIYEEILSVNTSEGLVVLLNTVVLGDSTIAISSPAATSSQTVADCEAVNEIIYGTEDGLSDGTDALTCNDDIIVCSGAGTGYTIQACNLGSNTTGTGASSYGHYFQFGRNTSFENGMWTPGELAISLDWEPTDWVDGIDDGSANYWGVVNAEKDTATFYNSTLENQIKMKGPCPDNYHIPTNKEWIDLHAAGGAGWIFDGIDIMNALKMPMSGRLDEQTSVIELVGNAYYWSSSPEFTSGHVMYYNSGYITDGDSSRNRATGINIRCFKN